jgi:hypothetical protein
MEHIHGPGEEHVAFLRVSKYPHGVIIRPAVISSQIVHGVTYDFPGYELIHVPEGVKIFTNPELVQKASDRAMGALTVTENISKGTSGVKSLISLFQLIFSAVTLWRVRGNQLATYGYAAFSLSVAPYAVMAAANLLANMVSPQYQTMFLVRNEVLDEAESLYGLKVGGAVGELCCMPAKPDLHPLLRFDGSGVRFMVLEEENLDEVRDGHGDRGFPLKIVSPDEAVREGLLPSKQVTIPPHADYIQDVETKWQLLTADIVSL